MHQPEQKFSIFLCLKVPAGQRDKKFTEAAVRQWLKKRLKDCELGEILFGDVVENISPYKK